MATGNEASRDEIARLLKGVKMLSTRYGGQNMYSDPAVNELSRAIGWMADELLDVMENGMDSLRLQMVGDDVERLTPPKALWKRIERRFYEHRNAANPAPEFEPKARVW